MIRRFQTKKMSSTRINYNDNSIQNITSLMEDTVEEVMSTSISQIQQQPHTISPSISASLAINQSSTKAPINLINDVDANHNKIYMVKSFSNESGMNKKWAKKCLEENGWDYTRAATCFLDLKAKIPVADFIHE